VVSIPVRNIWWLMLYASDLGKAANPAKLASEDLPDDIPNLVAEILTRAVEQRQRRQLSTSFLPREAVLTRVRGRIDHLTTSRRQLLAKGQVACRFEELSIDSPRNRYVRAALDTVGRVVRKPELDPQRCVHWLRRLYEKAIGGFYRLHLDEAQWLVNTGKPLSWPLEEATPGIAQVFPSMRTDIVIDRRDQPQRLVIDTKFTGVLGRGWYREHSLRAGYVYQLYAYLRSQVNRGDPRADQAAGLLLHPAIHGDFDESVAIQGHQMRFATVDLAGSHQQIKDRLLGLVPGPAP
jgi:5-methylcytosine-specific restriction enzyme subunit McrC